MELGGQDGEDSEEDKLVLGAVRSGQKDLVHYVLPQFPEAGKVVDAATGNSTVLALAAGVAAAAAAAAVLGLAAR